jgi:hypothetical protein
MSDLSPKWHFDKRDIMAARAGVMATGLPQIVLFKQFKRD